MAKREDLESRIHAELADREKVGRQVLVTRILEGDELGPLEELFFFTDPSAFVGLCTDTLRSLEGVTSSSSDDARERVIRFAADLCIWARSYVPEWRLRGEVDGNSALHKDQLEELAVGGCALASKLSLAAIGPGERVVAGWRKDTVARLAAESIADPQAGADALVGDRVDTYVTNMSAALAGSNVRRIAEMRARGESPTDIGNDYAAFLDYAMLVGASFVTCNPPLVDMAWVADPERWDPVVDRIVRENQGATSATLATKVTLEIVLANMRRLRPVFLVTAGRTGYVSLQVNPKNHDNATAMSREAEGIYADLEKRLGGGVPNVVFKLPATSAGLAACRALTRQGIGVNITVNFGMFQHMKFAEAIREGEALVSAITHMSGRLAFPVRDELLGKSDQLVRKGIDELQAREAAAWSGVAVLKRLQGLMTKRDYDFGRVKPLVASLRVYEGDAYKGLPTGVPDISEVIGTGIITIFPNVRHAFDALPAIVLSPRKVENPVPDRVLEILGNSEIFKQAFHVGAPDWLEGEDDRFRPDRVLRLDDDAAVIEWLPVKNTIAEFCRSYDAFVQRIETRREVLGGPSDLLAGR